MPSHPSSVLMRIAASQHNGHGFGSSLALLFSNNSHEEEQAYLTVGSGSMFFVWLKNWIKTDFYWIIFDKYLFCLYFN